MKKVLVGLMLVSSLVYAADTSYKEDMLSMINKIKSYENSKINIIREEPEQYLESMIKRFNKVIDNNKETITKQDCKDTNYETNYLRIMCVEMSSFLSSKKLMVFAGIKKGGLKSLYNIK